MDPRHDAGWNLEDLQRVARWNGFEVQKERGRGSHILLVPPIRIASLTVKRPRAGSNVPRHYVQKLRVLVEEVNQDGR